MEDERAFLTPDPTTQKKGFKKATFDQILDGGGNDNNRLCLPVAVVCLALSACLILGAFTQIGHHHHHHHHQRYSQRQARPHLDNNKVVEVDRDGKTEADRQFDVLLEWMVKSGAVIDGVAAKSMFAGGGRGLYATRDIRKGQKLFTIPSILWLSDRNAAHATALSVLAEKDELVKNYFHKGSNWGLILMYEYEKHNKFSFWKPYTDFIPIPASTIWWSDEELLDFQTDHVLSIARDQQKRIQKGYDELMGHLFQRYPHMFDRQVHTLDSFAYSCITAWSRSYDVASGGGEEKENALVPLGDVINHVSGTPSSHWSMKRTEDCRKDQLTFDFPAPEAKKAGEEVVISYSNKRSTMSWVIWAGFVPRETTFGDYILITLPATLTKGETHCFVSSDGQLGPAFLDAVTSRVKKSNNKDVQRVALEAIAKSVEKSLQSLPTTLEEDEGVLNSRSDHPYRQFVTLTYRIRFKKILKKIVENIQWKLDTGNLQAVGDRVWPGLVAKSVLHEFHNKSKWNAKRKRKHALCEVQVDLKNV